MMEKIKNERNEKEEIQITKVPVVYQMWGRVEVEHKDDVDLMQKLQDPMFVENMPLPEEAGYLEESYEIDFEGLEEIDEEKQEYTGYTTVNNIKRNNAVSLTVIENIQGLEVSLDKELMLGRKIGTIYNYGAYKKEPLIFSKLRLEDAEKYNLIEMFERLYGDTGQDTEKYAFEFVIVIRALFDGEVILNAKNLAIEDCLESIRQHLSPRQWKEYYSDYYLLNT